MSWLARAARATVRQPGAVVRALRHPWLHLARRRGEDLRDVTARVLAVPRHMIDAYARELETTIATRSDVLATFQAHRGRPLRLDVGLPSLYAAVRVLRPTTIVETGVFDGCSSLVWLLALAANHHGHLHSIDLPATDTAIAGSTDGMRVTQLPPGCAPGWLVPADLAVRWRLTLDDARVALPRLLARVGPIDVFYHDSLHTAAHMAWEYRTAWPHLRPGGLLGSDDIGWNAAFFAFALQTRAPYGHDWRIGVVRHP